MLVFFCIRKQVAFVVESYVPVRLHPEHAVIILTILFYDHAAGKNTAIFYSDISHPPHRIAIHCLRKLFGGHAKTRAEHFRQGYHMLVALYSGNHFFVLLQVGGFVLPYYIWLYERYM